MTHDITPISKRKHNHFNEGDTIVVFIANWKNKTVEGCWTQAHVIYGDRHHEGMVHFETLFPIHPHQKECYGNAGFKSPEIMLEEEFQKLTTAPNNEELISHWLGENLVEGFTKSQFVDSFRGKLAKPN